jgi:hypothetical protein
MSKKPKNRIEDVPYFGRLGVGWLFDHKGHEYECIDIGECGLRYIDIKLSALCSECGKRFQLHLKDTKDWRFLKTQCEEHRILWPRKENC